MKYELDQKKYEVVIERKNNKNTYIRVKDDYSIYVTTNLFVTKSQIKKILDENNTYLRNMFVKIEKKHEKEKEFYYLGNRYDIILMNIPNIEICENYIYVKSKEYLDKWYKKEMLRIFNERLDYYYSIFEESIPYPNLKIRKMKTRWGVCNKQNITVTLNSELIKYDLEKIDYVVVHELAHFVYFDHSKNFWDIVSKYIPNYKQIRKALKE